MPARSFTADAAIATETALPVPRAIAFQVTLPDGRAFTLRSIRQVVKDVLPDWEIHRFEGMEGWLEATPPLSPPDRGPMPLGEFWERVRALRDRPEVTRADPLFLVANPDSTETIGFVQDQLGLWGWPYDDATREQIERIRNKPTWHLASRARYAPFQAPPLHATSSDRREVTPVCARPAHQRIGRRMLCRLHQERQELRQTQPM